MSLMLGWEGKSGTYSTAWLRAEVLRGDDANYREDRENCGSHADEIEGIQASDRIESFLPFPPNLRVWR